MNVYADIGLICSVHAPDSDTGRSIGRRKKLLKQLPCTGWNSGTPSGSLYFGRKSPP
jgi:hypothetical protein